MGKTDIFLDKYKQLEDTVRQKYGDGFNVSRLEDMGEFKRYASKIKYARELRNLLVHNPKLDGAWPVDVNDGMISFVEKIKLLVEKPPRVCDCALGIKQIMYSHLGANVVDVMRQMSMRDISKVPILDRGKVIGVFSHDSVFSRLLSEKHDISENTVFRDIISDLSIEGDRAKRYRFAKWTELSSNIEEIFDKSNEQHIRIKLIFLTENGKRDEKLMGIVTPWELMDID